MKLQAKLTKHNAGIFDVIASECPMRTAAETMGLPAPHCCDGVITNVQGPVILRRCQHASDDSLIAEGKTLYCECGFKAKPRKVGE